MNGCIKLRLILSMRLISKVTTVERIVHILAIVVNDDLALASVMRVGSYLIDLLNLILSLKLILIIRRGIWQ